MAKLFVGNLPFSLGEDTLREAFQAFGRVGKVNIVTDRDTGQSRGFGFVEMPNDDDAQHAKDGLHETSVGGRRIIVDWAKEKRRTGGQ